MLLHLFYAAIILGPASILKTPGIPKVDMGDLNAFFRESANVVPYDTVYYFDQLVDHDDPSKETFKQRYRHNTELGGPIMQAKSMRAVLYVTDRTINGVVAQKFGGAAIVLEHRFFWPYPNLNVDKRRDNGDSVGPDNVPWILMGGSYPGGLASRHILDRLRVIGSRASPAGGIVSRFNSDLACVVEFPDAFHTIPVLNGDSINAPYGVWGVKNKRLFFANGKCEGDGCLL
ncbi:hypothetical protein ARMSODRAFT_1020090 [Armillaria solidipes]|uniref:Alpha/beta-hydrolase n=1 Tax=Armillaria solidipes TaxID=1076256 RepID=A0A2H3BB04_9AGAR|nr:hypothetical protein ARMSODRAFT_1020090 [Armillaria solidipes]